jgi:hypothetical protein
MLILNILPVRGCLADLGAVGNGACTCCGGREDVAHFLLHCQ